MKDATPIELIGHYICGQITRPEACTLFRQLRGPENR